MVALMRCIIREIAGGPTPRGDSSLGESDCFAAARHTRNKPRASLVFGVGCNNAPLR
jgi:hypothetical protein